MKKPPPIVEVVWEDSAIAVGRWEDRQDAIDRVLRDGPKRIATSGFLVSRTRRGVLVCAAFDIDRDDVAACMWIPRSAIREIRKL